VPEVPPLVSSADNTLGLARLHGGAHGVTQPPNALLAADDELVSERFGHAPGRGQDMALAGCVV
jgi:hypothetical protein